MTRSPMPVAGATDGQVFVPPRGGTTRAFIIVLVLIVAVGGLVPAGVSWYYGRVERNLQFVIDGDGLTVDYGFGSIHIAGEDVVSVQHVVDPPSMTRISGAGLKGLQMGWYRLQNFGRVYRLTTTGKDVVFIDTSPEAVRSKPNTRYVFNPAEPERFVELLQSGQFGQESAADGTSVFEPRTNQRGGDWLIGVIVALLVVMIGIVLVWFVLRGRRGLSYEVGPRGITVHHLGSKSYDWSSVKNVTVLHESPRLLRLFGTSLPGYYAGLFRSSTFGNVQVNATRCTAPLVLIETLKDKLIVSPENIDGFVQAVEHYRGNM